VSVDVQHHDRFYMRQRVRFLVNQYEVSTLAADGKGPDELIAYAEQRTFKLKEEIPVYRDPSKEEQLFTIRARKVLDLGTTYDIEGAGEAVGSFRKLFKRSLIRSSWELLDTEGNVIGTARERSMGIAITRRVQDLLGIIPLIGDLISLIPIPYHFDYFIGDRQVGSMNRQIRIGDRYVIDFSADADHRLDRRLALAQAIALDALQSR
jgi:hypothetical protein